jgi:hypothetical protein
MRILRAATVLGMVALVAGLLVIVAQSFAETLADPTLSLEDGFRIGRLPWMNVGVALVVAGTNAALVGGTLVSWVVGGWVRRVLALVPAAAGASWWLAGLLTVGAGAWCPGCPPPSFDPITTAYSLPDATVLLLVLPAFAAGILALRASRVPRIPLGTLGAALSIAGHLLCHRPGHPRRPCRPPPADPSRARRPRRSGSTRPVRPRSVRPRCWPR